MAKRHVCKVLILSTGLCAGAGLPAQASESGQGSLAELIAAAEAQSPSLAEHRGVAEALRQNREEGSSWDQPELRLAYGRDVDGGTGLDDPEDPNQQLETRLRVFPKNPWERAAQKKQIAGSVREQAALADLLAAQLADEVKRRYWDLCYHRAEAKVFGEIRALREAQGRNSERLLHRGESTMEQHLAVRISQRNAATQEAEALQVEQELAESLAAMTGVAPERIHLSSLPVLTEAQFAFATNEWIAIAAEQRIELKLHEARREIILGELEAARADGGLWVKHLQGSYQLRDDLGERDGYGVQIAVALPLGGDGKTEAALAQGRLRVEDEKYALVLRRIQREVTGVQRRLASFQRQWREQEQTRASLYNDLKHLREQMEMRGGQGDRNYWELGVAQLKCDLEGLELSRRYQHLLLDVERALGIPLKPVSLSGTAP